MWKIIGIIALILMVIVNVFFILHGMINHGMLTGTDDEYGTAKKKQTRTKRGVGSK